MKELEIFPFGICIGNLTKEDTKFPFLIDSKKGGFCVLYDKKSERLGIDIVEHIALNLLEVMAYDKLKVRLIDFGRNKFLYLATIKDKNIFDIYFSREIGYKEFEKLEEHLQYRNHYLLNYELPTLNDYNKANNFCEPYFLLLLNLDSFPDEDISEKRIYNFISSAYDGGYFIIPFGTKDMQNNKAVKTILDYYNHIEIDNNSITISDELYPLKEIKDIFNYEFTHQDREIMVKNILAKNKRIAPDLKAFKVELKHSAINTNTRRKVIIEPKIEGKIRINS